VAAASLKPCFGNLPKPFCVGVQSNRSWLRTALFRAGLRFLNIHHGERRGPRRTTEFFMLDHQALTERIIGCAIEVHRTVGPGLLESVYAECVALELRHAGIRFDSQVTVPVIYKGVTIPLGFRADVVVENTVILEIKAVAALLPAHESQLLTYLRMSHLRIGLLMNFHAPRLKDGLRRFIV
jgi:GxxExxY protein